MLRRDPGRHRRTRCGRGMRPTRRRHHRGILRRRCTLRRVPSTLPTRTRVPPGSPCRRRRARTLRRTVCAGRAYTCLRYRADPRTRDRTRRSHPRSRGECIDLPGIRSARGSRRSSQRACRAGTAASPRGSGIAFRADRRGVRARTLPSPPETRRPPRCPRRDVEREAPRTPGRERERAGEPWRGSRGRMSCDGLSKHRAEPWKPNAGHLRALRVADSSAVPPRDCLVRSPRAPELDASIDRGTGQLSARAITPAETGLDADANGSARCGVGSI